MPATAPPSASRRQDVWDAATPTPQPLPQCAVVPERTADPRRAAELFARDGAVIWTGSAGTAFHDAASVPAAVFGAAGVRSYLPPIKICYGNGAVFDEDVLRDGGAHTDGYAYGDSVNDAFVLLCERGCTGGGGANFLVDAAATAAALERDSASAWLPEALRCRVINQTSTCTCTECVPDGQPLESIAPIMQTVAAPSAGAFAGQERSFFRLFSDQRILGTEPEADDRMIQAYRAAMQAQAKAAPRFTCEPGDALIVDNWRLLHGRDRYFDKRRSLWRVWFWTDGSASKPLPPNDWRLTHMDEDEAALAAREAAGWNPQAIAAAIETPPAHEAMLRL